MTITSSFIKELIQDLASETFDTDDVYNEYAYDDPLNAVRRDNLVLYLHQVLHRRPKYLLVMEAPGYRGCRLTGVPVTSRKILSEGVTNLEMFGEHRGFKLTEDAGFENVYGEQSATIVWTALSDLGVLPLIWNTFPFHPRKGADQRTNRKPRVSETQLGAKYLHEIVDFFRPEVIVAVGNVAHDTMMGHGINCLKVRHPAQGGKNDFVAGLNKILSPKPPKH